MTLLNKESIATICAIFHFKSILSTETTQPRLLFWLKLKLIETPESVKIFHLFSF